jgi:hypothetical protein
LFLEIRYALRFYHWICLIEGKRCKPRTRRWELQQISLPVRRG